MPNSFHGSTRGPWAQETDPLGDRRMDSRTCGQVGQKSDCSATCDSSRHDPKPLLINWAELWQANQVFYTVWGKIQLLKQMLTLLDFGTFQKISKIVGKSSAHPVGVFSMRPNPPKCHIWQNQ